MADRGDIKDLSMLELFRMETDAQSAILTSELLELELNPDSEEKLETLMRAAHSLKGAARIVGMETVVGIAHHMEDCFVAAQRRSLHLTRDHIDVLLQAVDVINRIAHLPESEVQTVSSANQRLIGQLIQQVSQRLQAIKSVQYQYPMKQSVGGTDINENRDPLSSEGNLLKAQSAIDDTTYHATDPANVVHESEQAVLRIDADRLTKLMGLSSELMVESRWLGPHADSMLQLKKRYAEIFSLLEKLREKSNTSLIVQHSAGMLAEAQRKLFDCHKVLTERILALDDYDRRIGNLSSQIYHEVLASRMRPFADCIQGLARMARDTARKLNKEVRLVFEGLDTPMDRNMLDKFKMPLNHLVINAIDHGIESPEHRENAGKPPHGTIQVRAQQLGGMLVITIEDDGSGIDLDILKAKILKKRLIAKDVLDHLSEQELLEFLYLPDFSTRHDVTEYSGRGVGLDVVRNMVYESRGNIRISSQSGAGARFTLQMPLTKSVVSALIVNIADEPYGFPLSRVEMVTEVSQAQSGVIKAHRYIELNGELIGLISARHLFGINDYKAGQFASCHVIVVGNQNKKYGLVVDAFHGQKDLSVQPLDGRLGKVQDIGAAALLEDGRPVLIVDVDDLLRSIEVAITDGVGRPTMTANDPSQQEPKSILIVDDSMTVREIERQLLHSNGYKVDVAVDGIDGWNAVRRKTYHLVITDVDMPRMDGIELVHALKQDNHLKSIPIMIVSYKDRPEDKQRGLNAGADYYLTKGSFHDETLIEAVQDLIGEATT